MAENKFWKGVLILIVMDNGLSHEKSIKAQGGVVLILIVMDNGLSQWGQGQEEGRGRSLNPYCNG